MAPPSTNYSRTSEARLRIAAGGTGGKAAMCIAASGFAVAVGTVTVSTTGTLARLTVSTAVTHAPPLGELGASDDEALEQALSRSESTVRMLVREALADGLSPLGRLLSNVEHLMQFALRVSEKLESRPRKDAGNGEGA